MNAFKAIAVVALIVGSGFGFMMYERSDGYAKLTRRMHVTYKRGDLIASEQAAKDRIKYIEDHFQSDPAKMSQAVHDLAFVYNAAGKYPQAIRYLTEAVTRASEEFGSRNFRTAIYLDNLGSAYLSVGRFKDARSLSKQAHDIFLDVFGGSSRHTLIAKANLSSAEMALGECSHAAWWAREGLRVAQQRFENRPLHGRLLQRLGAALTCLGQQDLGIPMLRDGVQILEQNDISQMERLQVYLIHAGVLEVLGQTDESHQYLEKALRLSNRISGKGSFQSQLLSKKLRLSSTHRL